ncbi:hypothetical protein [Aliikangiella coralliicola]|uniref:Uncharacterized protein n=1 Tax=Aliikangiella coralliicola TaxID=2592383 RepID=A0A545UBN3_9GAMM|nr:hypothetical protein [Aliikangiella coralliicola]TQV86876.1 hypothetical protein FLL46_13750 [Aliikangiella coralliicola]
MMNNILRYLITLIFGMVIGYSLFSLTNSDTTPPEIEVDTTNDTYSNLRDNSAVGSEKTADSKRLDDSSSNNEQRQIADNDNQDKDAIQYLTLLTREQQSKIEQLQQQLNALNPLSKNETENPPKELQTLSMDDFQNKMKDQFVEQFRGYAIELSDEQLDSVKKTFETSSEKANWNAEYENRITDYIQEADSNGLHFIDELTCNQNMCRLKVQSNEPKNWQQIYSSMTQQKWYNTMTLIEKTDEPGQFIYYIPKPQDI